MRALIIESDNGVGDTLTIGVLSGGTVEIEIDEPWSGDTERGFGHSSRWDLTIDQMILIRDHLDAIIKGVERQRQIEEEPSGDDTATAEQTPEA